MSVNNKILVFLLACLMSTACQTTSRIPKAYNFSASEAKNNPFGCWTIMTMKPEKSGITPETFAGELLYSDADTLFILVMDNSIKSIYSESVKKAELYTHRNQAGSYFAMTSLLLTPNIFGLFLENGIYSDSFLELGIPLAVIGFITALVEGSNKRNILVYPEKNNLDDFINFARYPAGKPLNVDFKELTLKKLNAQ